MGARVHDEHSPAMLSEPQYERLSEIYRKRN
jgi:hypothetical protein